MHILIVGNPVDGFAYRGPFACSEDAIAFAERSSRCDEWWIAMLEGADQSDFDSQRAELFLSVPNCEGWRIAENTEVNVGFYVRPDDQTSFSPCAVYPTPNEAWTAFHAER